MKILNLYAGIGGNRKLWGDEHEVTAVELDENTADVYVKFFPNDTLIRKDAHQYLLEHYKEFDFIWSSPPCPSHSITNLFLNGKGHIRYPDMRLYQEIILLKRWGYSDKVKWCIENVMPYYKPLIHASFVMERHLFWTNFRVVPTSLPKLPSAMENMTHGQLQKALDIKLPSGTEGDKRLMLRDITRPEIGVHILKAALKETKQEAML